MSESPAHVPGVPKGEETVEREGREPGRYPTGSDDTPAGRPHGTSTARDDTGVDPQEPVTGGTPKG
ncbi:MAG TPA: hypothetical protein VFW71_14680 [Actinomycetota bacterium]|nr:hypothetical protein [Actinomycetota bacterium]